jgi:hypothetical protein
MLIPWVSTRKSESASRWRVGRQVLLYHAVLGLLLLALPSVIAPRAALLVIAAFAPALVRAVYGVARLSGAVPSFRRVGLLESAYAAWFAVLMSMALPVAQQGWGAI